MKVEFNTSLVIRCEILSGNPVLFVNREFVSDIPLEIPQARFFVNKIRTWIIENVEFLSHLVFKYESEINEVIVTAIDEETGSIYNYETFSFTEDK